ncbi:MAG: FtsX-like permease family protein [Clostridia bacterium]|nr:FtsX-like permease family protein [Clostridia bacterium]
MSIIIKFILRNIKEKKFRTFLIVFSIVISSALYFASSAMSDTMVKMFEDRMRNYYGNADILIFSNQKSPSSFFTDGEAQKFKDKLQYIIGETQSSGSYTFNRNETLTISLRGSSLEDYQQMNPVYFAGEKDLYPFEGKKLILSKNTVEKYKFKLGDTIDLQINNSKHRFTLSGIAEPTGLFTDDGMNTFGIVPFDALNSIYSAHGRSNLLSIKVKNPEEKLKMIAELSKVYERYTVKEPISKEELKQQTQGMTTSFLLMAFIVTIMSIFIIYTSFKVVTMERLPVIGTFRSIGATRKMTDFVLVVESILYGVIGGLAGCILGIGILYLMAIASKPVWVKGFKVAIEFSPIQLAYAFIFAIVLALISCLIPILKVSKIPVKDIVLNSLEKQKKKTHWKLVLGFAFLGFAFIAPPLAPKELALFVDITGMALSVSAVVLLVPYLTALFVKLFEKVYIYIFGNEGILAVKNLRENKSILNNISLLAIGISSLLMINTISFSVVTELTSFYRSATFDIWIMHMGGMNKTFESTLAKTAGIQDLYSVYEAHQVDVESHKGNRISLVQGVDKDKFEHFWNMEMSDNPKALMTKLDSGRYVILTYTLKEKLGVKKGDIITLKMKAGSKSFEIIGFASTLRNNGSYALISEKYVKADSESQFYSNVFIKTNKDPEEVLKELQGKFARRYPFMRTVKQMELLEKQSNENIFLILKGFSILALIIGIFGVLNNLIISFIERKRALAMFRSIGMSKPQIVKMLFIEAFSAGLIGGITGIGGGFLMIWGVPYVLMSINMFVPITYPVLTLGNYLISGIVIVLAASISPALKSSRLQIIEAIKYE